MVVLQDNSLLAAASLLQSSGTEEDAAEALQVLETAVNSNREALLQSWQRIAETIPANRLQTDDTLDALEQVRSEGKLHCT